ncbi:unnamed protein product [Rotaria magnacalcarata]|uniref:Uncharacterized protein n=2 Tax=Rotaria magnacalcarata TaxID=392030 RepID=A0A818ZGU3_9BILA|nr:unnamed protein product [Rotaria magnacalcarata]
MEEDKKTKVTTKIIILLKLPNKPLSGQGGSITENVPIGGKFDLIDQDGNKFNSKQMNGHLSLVYFGFTYCPDICPTTLNKLSNVISTLEKYKIDIMPIFITIDPKRDTSLLLKEYLGHFYPKFIGLTGSEEDLKYVADLYKVISISKKTEVELSLERLENDQRILQQEKERLELLREKEVEKAEAERRARSGDVEKELEAALGLFPCQDSALETQVKTLESLEKQKKEKLAEKELLESSTQERINELLQEHSDVRRLDIIGLERAEKEIQVQARESVIREKTEKVDVQKELLKEVRAEVALQTKNIQDLERMRPLLLQLGEARQELQILEQAQGIVNIENEKAPFDKFLEYDKNISTSELILKELNTAREELDKRYFDGERSEELKESRKENQNLIEQANEALELLELAQTIRDNKDVSKASMEELLPGVEKQQEKWQEELDRLNSEIQPTDKARVSELISDDNLSEELDSQKEKVEKAISTVKSSPGYKYLSRQGEPINEVIFQMAAEEQLAEKNYSYETNLDKFVKNEKESLREKSEREYDLGYEVQDLESELAKIKKAKKVELSPELTEELEQAKQKIRDNNSRKKLALEQEMQSVESAGIGQAETFARDISSLDKRILEEEFNKLEASRKAKVVKSKEQEYEERFYFASKDLRAVKLRDTVAHRRELREQEESLRKEFREEITSLQVENERLRRAAIEEVEKERELSRRQIDSLTDQLREKDEQVSMSGVSLAEEFAQMRVPELEKELQDLRLENQRLKEASDKEIALLQKQVQEKGEQVGLLEGQIQEKEKAIIEQAKQGKLALDSVQGEFSSVREQLGVAKSGSEQAVLLQAQLKELQQEKAGIIEKNELAAQEAQRQLEALELSKKEALEKQEKATKQLQISLDAEVASLIDKLQISEKRVQDQQRVIDSMGSYLSELDDRIGSLEAELIVAEQDIEGNVGDNAKLGKKVIQLEQEIAEAREERDDALGKKHKAEELLKEFQEFHEQELDRREAVLEHPRHLADKSEPKGHELPEEVHSVVTKIPDRVSTVTDDQMLKDFRDLRLMADIEHEKYKEIHSKYPHSDIEWQGKNQVSINKDGVELCKLNSKPVTPPPAGYELDGQKIANYRSLELPLKAESGPMHMSLAAKDLQGNNISGKNAVYLTAHYDKQGKLVEMTAPIPVYYTDEGRESPVCIKRDGKTYTLPVNRGQYEDMLKQIEVNKGLQAELGVEKSKSAPLGKESLSKDLIRISAKVSPHSVKLVEGRHSTFTPVKQTQPVKSKEM